MEIARNRRGELAVKLDTKEDKIQAYTIGQYAWDDLTEAEKRIYKRWISVRNLSLTEFSPNQIVKSHIKLLNDVGIKISESTAWSDYRNAMEMWGNSGKISYQAKLSKYEEYLLQAWKIASEERDTKGLAAIARSLIELAKQIREVDLNADEYREPNTFILAVKYSESDQEFTIDLDSFEQMPNKEQEELLLQAVDKHNLSEMEFRKMLGGDKDED